MMYLLALSPILVLILLSLTKGVKVAVLVGMALTTALFFYWGAGIPHLLAVLSVSALTTLNILMIVLGAAFLYNVMFHLGQIDKISRSLDNLHPSVDLRFFVLAFGLTAFFEGVAGFGTPGAIVPLILVALGFEAVLSVSVVLLLDGLFATFGAVGTPIITGLQLPLGLEASEVQKISLIAALLMVLVGLVLLFLVFRLVGKQQKPLEHQRQMLLLYCFFAVPFVAFSWLAPELATVLGALVMLGLSVLYLKRGEEKLDLKAWLPYAVLALLLLLPKLSPTLRDWLAWELRFTDLFGTTISAALKPLQSPLFPFLLVGLGVALFHKSKALHLREPLQKMAAVSVVLFPSIAIAQLMIYSGVEQPSMVRYIADLLSQMGNSYVLVSPFVGIMGTFITGSTTISNLVFGASQLETATTLSMNRHVILALQLTGASIGNAVCLFNILAAASIANIKNYRAILLNNLVPTLLDGLVLGLLGLLLLQLVY